MKNNRIKMLIVFVIASLALSSCSVQRQRHDRDRYDGRDHHDNRGNEGNHYGGF